MYRRFSFRNALRHPALIEELVWEHTFGAYVTLLQFFCTILSRLLYFLLFLCFLLTDFPRIATCSSAWEVWARTYVTVNVTSACASTSDC